MFSDISCASLTIPCFPIEFGEPFFRIIREHVPEEDRLVFREIENDAHLVQAGNARSISYFKKLLPEHRLHSFRMNPVSGEFVDIDALDTFHFSDERFFRITPTTLESLRSFFQFGKPIVDLKELECLFFRDKRLFFDYRIVVVEMRERIGFAGEACDLFFMLQRISEIYAISECIASEEHLRGQIGSRISRMGTERFGGDGSSHGFQVKRSPWEKSELVEYRFHLRIGEKEAGIFERSFLRIRHSGDGIFIQSSGLVFRSIG